MRGAIGPGDSLKTYPVVFGTTREGEAMTILYAHRAGMSLNFGSGGVSRASRSDSFHRRCWWVAIFRPISLTQRCVSAYPVFRFGYPKK